MSKLIKSVMSFLLLSVILLGSRLEATAAPIQEALTATPTPPNCISVVKAVNQGLIKLTLTANGKLFFQTPLHYSVTNLTTKTQQICFFAGQINQPDDPSLQALMIVKTVLLTPGPNQVLTGDLSADCINESKHAPSDGDGYQLGEMAQGKLLRLAKAIDANSAQGRLGAQMAIWVITDQFSLNDLNATPSPDQPSLTDSIRPLLCLAQDDVSLGEQLLQEAEAGANLYQGENPLTSYCQSQGIPSLSQLQQQLTAAGERALIILGAGVLGCIIVVIVIIVLVVRLVRRRK